MIPIIFHAMDYRSLALDFTFRYAWPKCTDK